MDDALIVSLKGTIITLLVGYVVYRVLSAILRFRAYAKIFDACPGETEKHWLFGTLHKYPGPNEEGLKYDAQSIEKWPRFARFWAGPVVPLIVLWHPDLVKVLLKSSAPKPRGGLMASAYEMGLGWLGEGLLISNGARWSRSRRLLTPAFHFDVLKPYLIVSNRAGDILLDKFRKHADDKKSLEVFHNISLCLFDILLQCAFNHNSDCQRSEVNDPFVKSVNELVALWSERWLKPWRHIEFIYRWLPHGRRWYKLCDYVHSVSEELIDKRRKILEAKESGSQEDGDDRGDKRKMLSFVDILLTAKDEDGQGMTPLEIRNEADTFLFEGFDTTTSALSWTLYSVSRWTEHQTAIQQEVDAILKGRSSDDILWEDLPELTYTTACIKEAMRLYSTVPFIERQIEEPMEVDGHRFPAGTFVAVQIWCLHHNPAVWEEPYEYLPNRFMPDQAAKMDPFQFVPFSAGPRNCIGQNFAMHELKVLVARILHRFTLKLDPDHEVKRASMATFKSETDIKLIVKPRNCETA